MSFTRLANRFVCVSRWYKTYMKMGKGSKCSRLLFRISDQIKLDIDTTTKEELPIIHQVTKTSLAYMDDTELSTLLFQRNILLDPFDEDVLGKFISFLQVYGWGLEAEQLEHFLITRYIGKASIFAVNLELYKNGRQHDMTENELSAMLIRLNLCS